ncbi:hypothetical protein HK096_009377, partial [Nowakowskiella sp. JEL0078]
SELQTSESVPEINETAIDLATEVSSMDAVPTLLFLLLLNGLIFISNETPPHLQVILVECMSSCLAITLGPKCVSHTLVAFVSSILQEYKAMEYLLNLANRNDILTKPILHIIASLLDILDDFNIMSDEEPFQNLIRESWSLIQFQSHLIHEKCVNPLAFTNIAFPVIQNTVSLLNISKRQGMEYPAIHVWEVVQLLQNLLVAFAKLFGGYGKDNGAKISCAAKIHFLMELCIDILPDDAQQELERLTIEMERLGVSQVGKQAMNQTASWKWGYMLSSRKGVLEMKNLGILVRDINQEVEDGDVSNMCGCEVYEKYGGDFHQACMAAGTFCHNCRNFKFILTPKRVMGQKKYTNNAGLLIKEDITSLEDWVKVVEDIIGKPELAVPEPRSFEIESLERVNIDPEQTSIKEKEKDKDKNLLGGKKEKEKEKSKDKKEEMSVAEAAEAVAKYEGVGGRAMGGGNIRTPIVIGNEALEAQKKTIDLNTLDFEKLINDTISVSSRALASVQY